MSTKIRRAKRTEIEIGVEALLKPLRLAGVTVAPYSGEIQRANNQEELWSFIAGAIPAVLVMASAGTYRPKGGSVLASHEINVDVFAVAGSLRDRIEHTHGGPRVIGAHELIESVRDCLIGQIPTNVDDVTALTPISDEPVIFLPQATIWLLKFKTITTATQPRSGEPVLIDLYGTLNLTDDPSGVTTPFAAVALETEQEE